MWIATSRGTDWQELKERLEGSSPAGAELAGRARELLGMTAGAALAGWDSEEMRIHAAARLGEGKKKWLWTRWIG